MEAWGVEDVAAWLASLELEGHCGAFRSSAIDGPLLVELTEADLHQLGVTNKFHVRKILQRRDKALAAGGSEAAQGEQWSPQQLLPPPHADAGFEHGDGPDSAERAHLHARLLRGKALGHGEGVAGGGPREAAAASTHHSGAASSPPFPGRLRPLAQPPSPPPLELPPSDAVLRPRSKNWRAEVVQAHAAARAPNGGAPPASRFTASQEEVSDLMGLLQDAAGVGAAAQSHETPGPRAVTLLPRSTGGRAPPTSPPPDPGAVNDASAALSALRRAAGAARETEQALLALCSVARRSQGAAVAVLTTGAPPQVVATVRDHGVGHTGIASAAASAMCALCGLPIGYLPSPGHVAELRDAPTGSALSLGLSTFAAAQAVAPLIACLSAHASNAPVAAAVLTALAVLTAGHPECAQQAAEATSGGLDALVVALYVHADVPAIQASGCTALAALLVARPNQRAAAMAAGAAEVVQYATRRHGQHGAVQAAAQAAAAALGQELGAASEVEDVPSSLPAAAPPAQQQQHRHNAAESAGHEQALSAAPAGQEELAADEVPPAEEAHSYDAGEAAAVPEAPPPGELDDPQAAAASAAASSAALVDVLRSDAAAASPEEVTKVLLLLSGQWTASASLSGESVSSAYGGVGAVIAAMRAHGNSGHVIAAGLDCLAAAVSGAGDSQRRVAARVVAAGGVALTAQALRRHVADVALCTSACSVLAALAPECSDARDAGTAAVAAATAAQRHSGNAALASAAKRARYALSFTAANEAAAAAGVAAVAEAMRGQKLAPAAVLPPAPQRADPPAPQERVVAAAPAPADDAASFEAFAVGIATGKAPGVGTTPVAALLTQLLTGLRRHGAASPVCALAACDALIALLSSSPAAGAVLWDATLGAAQIMTAALEHHVHTATSSRGGSAQTDEGVRSALKAAAALTSALALFADEESATEQVLAAGVAPALVRCMSVQQHRSEAQRSVQGGDVFTPLTQALTTAAATTGCALCADGRAAAELSDAGAMQAAAAALHACAPASQKGGSPSNATLAAALAGLVQALSASGEQCDAAGDSGVCEAVLACCPRGPAPSNSHPDDVQLHCALAAALRNLTVSAPNRARVMAAGGPAAVVAFLTRSAQSGGDGGAAAPSGVLAEHTCGTLRNLACDPGAAQALVAAGAAVAAVKALKAHARRHDTAEVAAAALANLTAGSSEAAQHVADAGGVEALCASMGAPGGAPAKGELRSVCAFALANISACPGAHSALATQGGIAALVDALQTGTAPATVLAGALSNLAATPAAVEAAHRNGAAFALLHSLRVAPDTASATACAAAVQALCASSPACAAACFAAGAAETLAACAKIHPEAAHACAAATAAVKSAGNGAPQREAAPSWTQAPEAAAGAPPPPQAASPPQAPPPLKSPDALVSSLVAAVSGGSASEVLSVLHACSSSCPDDRARVALASAGGIACACDALEWALTSLDGVEPGIAQTVAAAAAGLVANLASPAGSATSLAASDVAASLGAALEWRPRTAPNGSCPALAAVLSAVAAASAGDPRNAQRLAAGQVGPRVVEVLHQVGPACDDVADAGCRAVRFLGPTALVDSPNTLRAALAAVTACGQRHSSHNSVQYWADQALTALQAGPPGSPPPGSPPPEANQPSSAAPGTVTGQASAALVALAAAGGDARAAEAALAALMSAVAADPSQAGALCATGAVPAVIDALRACPRSSAVAMRGLGALAELCCDADTALQAATQGAVHAVVASMANHRQSASVQQEGCRAMVRLCASAKVASHVASGDMGAAVVAAVNDHVAHMGVQSWGRRLLTALDAIQNGRPPPPLDDSPPRSGSGSGGSSNTSTPPRKPPMAPTSPRNAQQVDAGKRAQQQQQEQQQPPQPQPPAQLSQAAQQAVAALSASTRDPAVDVENVIYALSNHLGDPDVCEKGLAVLVTLAGQGPSFRAVLGASSAAEMVTDVLAQHPQHPGVTRKACAALLAMCTPLGGRGNTPSEEDVACAIAVDAARPDAAIAASLRALSGIDAGAATAACKALAEVAVLSQDAAVRAVSDGEALPAVMATLRVHAAAGQPLLAQAALEALAALAEPRTEAVLHSSGAADVVIHLMRVHVDSAAAITAGAHAIAALSGSPAGCVRVATAGGVLALLRAMRAWPTDQGVQSSLLGALWNVTVTSDNQARTTAAGGTDLVTEALRRFGASSLSVAEAACGCIRNLACDPAAGQRLAGTGAVGAVLAALRAHGGGNADFTSLAQAALGNLLASPAACVAVLKIQPDDSQAVALASRALVTAVDPEEGVTAPHAAQTALRAAQGAGLTRDLVRALAQRHPVGGPGDNTSARRWVLQLLDVLQRTSA